MSWSFLRACRLPSLVRCSGSRRRRRLTPIGRLAGVGGLVAASAVIPVHVRAATAPLRCGAVVTTDTTLTADLACPEGNGLVIGAHGVRVDLGGFTITGGGRTGTKGIENPGFDDVFITGGRVVGFDRGIELRRDTRNSTVSGMTVRGARYGLVLFNSDGNVIGSNVLAENAKHGIWIDAASTGNRLSDNAANDNGKVGINVEVSAVDGGGNRAFANRGPVQCRNIACVTERVVHIAASVGRLTFDIAGRSSAPGTPLTVWDWKGSPNQLFVLRPAAGGTVTIEASHSQLRLDAGAGTPATVVTQQPPSGERSQRWRLVERDNGRTELFSMAGDGPVIDTGADPVKGRRLRLAPPRNSGENESQQFFFAEVDPGREPITPHFADDAFRFVGQTVDDVCAAADDPPPAIRPGQAPRAFVDCVIRVLSNTFLEKAIFDAFLNQDAEPVAAVEAVKGDVIQLFDPLAPNRVVPGLHTAIVVANVGGGRFVVLDGGWGSDDPVVAGPADGKVRVHLWDPYAVAAARGLEATIFSFVD